MNLADKIIAQSGSDTDVTLRGAYASLSKSIECAQRFYVSPETVRAAFNVTKSKPTSILAALPFCASPFESAWFEWDGGHWLDVDNEPMTPSKLGCLVEAIDGNHRRLGLTFAWVHSKKNFNAINSPYIPKISHLSVIVNWFDKWMPNSHHALINPDDNSTLTNIENIPIDETIWKKFSDDENQRLAIIDLMKRASFSTAPCYWNYISELQKNRSYQLLSHLAKTAMNDLKSEPLFIQALLCLLNAKGAVRIEKENYDKINKSRIKNNKKPFLSFSQVKIKLSDEDEQYLSETGATNAEIREHLVRGHFKIRKTGVYFWRPHIRGDSKNGRVLRTGYDVSGNRSLPRKNGGEDE